MVSFSPYSRVLGQFNDFLYDRILFTMFYAIVFSISFMWLIVELGFLCGTDGPNKYGETSYGYFEAQRERIAKKREQRKIARMQNKT